MNFVPKGQKKIRSYASKGQKLGGTTRECIGGVINLHFWGLSGVPPIHSKVVQPGSVLQGQRVPTFYFTM